MPTSAEDTARAHEYDDRAAPAAWELSRRFMLRTAALPVETVRQLRCPASRTWARQVIDASERLAASGTALGDLLHQLVGAEDEDAARRRLLRLRRDLFNNRLPHDPPQDLALVRARDAGVARSLDSWLSDRARLAELEAAGEDVVAGELATTRRELRDLAGAEALRHGLLLASPSLDAHLPDFVRSSPTRPDKRSRKVERSLLSYLYRTAAKTSPFSTFTHVALGEFTQPTDAAGEHPHRADVAAPGGPGRAGPRTVALADDRASWVRPNVLALERLAEVILADPARRADLPVTPAPGWGRDHDRVRYVRRWVTAGDDDTAVTFDSVQDRLFYLRHSGTLERLLSLFADRPVLRYGELTRWLANDRGADPAECERYLGVLLSLGMVRVPLLSTSVHDTDPMGAFCAALDTLDTDWAREVAATLAPALTQLERYPTADVAERRGLLADLRESLRQAQLRLGADPPRVPRTVLYEDSSRRPVTTPRAPWERAVAEPLRALERVLPAFDLTLPQRVTFQGFFVARFGEGGQCEDLLKLVHDFHEDFFDQYLSFTSRRTAFDAEGRYEPEVNWLGLTGLKALDTARTRFTAGIREAWQRHGTADELLLDGGLLEDVAADLGPVAPRYTLHSHHLQLAERPDDPPLVVLNRSYGGLFFPFSRFTHCFPDTAGTVTGDDGRTTAADTSLATGLRQRARELQPPGAVFAEVTGGSVTSNLNLHERLTDYEIVCPGERSSVPEDCQIPLEDLVLYHDVADDRLVLRSRRLDREVVPVYLGYLVPLALPEVARTLLLLSPTSMASVDPWEGVPPGAAVDGVTRRPRVRHGAVVVARRSWTAPASALPPRGTDAGWFLGWQRWRDHHRLPPRVFATVRGGGGRGATGAKPQFLDFDSALSLTAFEALLKNPDATVTFREMLPDEDSLHTVSADGHHVAELAVETVTPVVTPTAPTADERLTR